MRVNTEAYRLANQALALANAAQQHETERVLVALLDALHPPSAELMADAPDAAPHFSSLEERFRADLAAVALGPRRRRVPETATREHVLGRAAESADAVGRHHRLLAELRDGLWIHTMLRLSSRETVADVESQPDSPGGDAELQAIRELLQARHIDARLAERALDRLIWAAHQTGMSQRQIAQLVDESQSTIHRVIKRAGSDTRGLAVSPREIVERYESRQISRDAMLALLAEYPYDSGSSPLDAPDWGYLPGSWDELAQLALEGAVDETEFEFIVQRATAAAQGAAAGVLG